MKEKEKAQETESKKIEKIKKEFQEYVNRAFEKIKFCEGGGNYGIVYTDFDGVSYKDPMIEILRKKIKEQGDTPIEIKIKHLLEEYGPIIAFEIRRFNDDLYNEEKKPKNTPPIKGIPIIILSGFDELEIFNKEHIGNMNERLKDINNAEKILGLEPGYYFDSVLRNFFNECKINHYKAPKEGTDKYSSFLAYLKLFFHANGSTNWQDFWESRFPVALFILAPKRVQDSLAKTDRRRDYVERNGLGIFLL
jgi:hypothetical protein